MDSNQLEDLQMNTISSLSVSYPSAQSLARDDSLPEKSNEFVEAHLLTRNTPISVFQIRFTDTGLTRFQLPIRKNDQKSFDSWSGYSYSKEPHFGCFLTTTYEDKNKKFFAGLQTLSLANGGLKFVKQSSVLWQIDESIPPSKSQNVLVLKIDAESRKLIEIDGYATVQCISSNYLFDDSIGYVKAGDKSKKTKVSPEIVFPPYSFDTSSSFLEGGSISFTTQVPNTPQSQEIKAISYKNNRSKDVVNRQARCTTSIRNELDQAHEVEILENIVTVQENSRFIVSFVDGSSFLPQTVYHTVCEGVYFRDIFTGPVALGTTELLNSIDETVLESGYGLFFTRKPYHYAQSYSIRSKFSQTFMLVASIIGIALIYTLFATIICACRERKKRNRNAKKIGKEATTTCDHFANGFEKAFCCPLSGDQDVEEAEEQFLYEQSRL